MTALAVVACVALVCASALVAWRWWLSWQRDGAAKTWHDFDAALARFGEFERRLDSVEVRNNSTLRK